MNAREWNAGLAAATLADPRWQSVQAKDPKADGAFFYSVKSTGVYCRPSCGARLARPENVAFHATCADAERAGFRPCKRCKPEQATRAELDAVTVIRACRIIERSEAIPALDQLAALVDVSAWHFHRIFKRATGLTPRQYALAVRTERLRGELDAGTSVTEAIFAAGYGSNSRFYEKSNAVLGMTPTTRRAGGMDTEIHFAVGQCRLGSILVARSKRGVCAILMGDQPDTLVRELQDRFPQAVFVGGDAGFEQLVAKVVGLVESPAIGLDLPLDVRGTAFQQRVWQALQQIPPGQTISYSEVARRIGKPKAARAVAQACAANLLAVAIPCHRVVRNDGALSGYRWGVDCKRALLHAEVQSEPV